MKFSIKIAFYFFLFFPVTLSAINKPDTTKIKLEFSGFVNSQLFYDSRQVVESREAMLSLYPKKAEYDSEGKDINAKGSLNQLSMTTRLRLGIRGPVILNATPFALVEGDFTGPSNTANNGFRLREAFIRLDWKKFSVLTGQTWHPMNTVECRPSVIGLNTGSPFHPFSRHNQIQINYFVSHWKLIFAAASQRDFASYGPAGQSGIYLRNSIIPNLHLQLQYSDNHIKTGAGIDFKQLKPEEVHLFGEQSFSSRDKVNSWSAIAFVNYTQGSFNLKMSGIYGHNLTDHLLLGGYYESEIDTMSHRITYTASPLLTSWIQAEQKFKNWSFSLFGGYTQNLPYQKQNSGKYFGRNADIQSVYRWMPAINYIQGAFRIGAELECTAAAYGTPDLTGNFQDKERFTNYRFLVGVYYFFK